MGKRKHTKGEIEIAVRASTSILGVMRHLGMYRRSGETWERLRRYIAEYRIDTSHFRAHRLGAVATNRKPAEDVLVVLTQDFREKGAVLRRALVESGVPYTCAHCGQLPVWFGRPLTLHVDHQNGDWRDCRKENLRFLCPNCHTQEPSSRRGRHEVTRQCRTCDEPFTVEVNARGEGPEHCGKGCQSRAASAKAPRKPKVIWPSGTELQRLVWVMPVKTLAQQLGVSDVAVKKHCRRLGVPTPPRGYWAGKALNGR